MSGEQPGSTGPEAASPLPTRYGSARGPDGYAERVTGAERAGGLGRRRWQSGAASGASDAATGWGPAADQPAIEATQAIPVLPAPPHAAGRAVSRRLVRHVDVWTVFKVSLVFYLLLAVIVLAGGAVAWQVAAGLHLIRDVERAVRTLADKRRFVLHPLPVLEYSAAAAGALALVGTLANTVAAVLYNLISDVVGGVQTVEVVERV